MKLFSIPLSVNPARIIFKIIPTTLVGLVLLVAAFSKGTDIVRFSRQIEQLITSVVQNHQFDLTIVGFSIATAVLLIELLLGAMLVTGWKRETAARWSFLLFIGFIVVIIYEIARKSGADCGCFGALLRRSGWEALVEDIVILILLLPSLFRSASNSDIPLVSSVVKAIQRFAAVALFIAGIIWMVIFLFNPPTWSALQRGSDWSYKPDRIFTHPKHYVWLFSPNCEECQNLVPLISELSGKRSVYAITSATPGRVAEFELDFQPRFPIAIADQELIDGWALPNGSLAFVEGGKVKAVLKTGQIADLEQVLTRMER